MGAADATLEEGLGLLTGEWRQVADGLLRGEYSLWVGSAVSRERYPDLRELLLRLLTTLYERVDDERYARCLREILGLIGQDERDLGQSPEEWPDLELAVLSPLIESYSKVLGITIPGEAEDFIAWELLRLPEVYDDPQVEPDADHRLMALLMAEGVVDEVFTTNWDPLIEDAFTALADGPGEIETLTVVSSGSGAHSISKPLVCKIHGCARQMRRCPEQRRWLVSANQQILGWTNDSDWQPLREYLAVSIRNSLALFVGLSGQDTNLQSLYQDAVGPLAEENGFERQRVIFSKPALAYPQREILKSLFYGLEGGYSRRAEAIDRRSALPLYSKPLLGSLYVLCLLEKLRVLYEAGAADETVSGLDGLVSRGLEELRRALVSRYDAIDKPNERWRQLVQELPRVFSRFVRLSLGKELHGDNPWSYRALQKGHLRELETDENLKYLNLHRLVLALAMLQVGASEGRWEILAPEGDEASFGQLRLRCGLLELRIHVLLRQGSGLGRLVQMGAIDPGDGHQHLIVYVQGYPPPGVQRSPSSSGLPGVGASEPIEIWLEEHLRQDTSTELLESFEREIPCP